MMYGMKKSDEAIVPLKAANRARKRLRSRRREGPQPRGIRETKARTGRRVGTACHRRSSGYGKLQHARFAVNHPR